MSDFEKVSQGYKTIIIGKPAVGKSTLLLRYVDGVFNAQKPTVGIDYRFKKVADDQNIGTKNLISRQNRDNAQVCHQKTQFTLQLWDSAGQQRYRTVVYNFFLKAKAGCIVFDMTDPDSLDDARTWMQQLVLRTSNDLPLVLLGNKCDLLDAAKLEQAIAQYKPKITSIQQEFNCKFFPVSAYTGVGIDQGFSYLIERIFKLYRIQNKQPEPTPKPNDVFKLSQLSVNKEQKTKKKCC